MTTPAIDIWKHLAKNWLRPDDFTDELILPGDQKLLNTLIEIASDVVFLHGRSHEDLVEPLFGMWGDRPRMSSDFINKDEIRRILNCLREGWSIPMPIQEGVWDHFKGGVYKVHFLASWTGDEGGEVVVYTSLLHGTTHARHVTSWNEIVLWPDSVYRTRFVRRKDPKDPPLYKVPSPDGIV